MVLLPRVGRVVADLRLQPHAPFRQKLTLPCLTARRRFRRRRDGAVREAALSSVPSAVDTSRFVVIGSGFLLGLMSSLIIGRQLQRKGDGDRKLDTDMKKRLEEMEIRMKKLQAQAGADRDRVKVLEGARAAAVMDVTKALGQKRDVEFALKEAQHEIERLKQMDPLLKVGKLAEEEELVAQMFERLPEKLTSQMDSEALEELRAWLLAALKDTDLTGMSHNTNLVVSMDNLEAALKAEKQKVKEMRVEVKTVKEFAKTELRSMTQDLISGREEMNKLREEISDLKDEKTILKHLLSEAKKIIAELRDKIDAPESVDQSLERQMHEMRAEAAYMVESMEDQAYKTVQKALQTSQSAQQAALREFVEAARAKDREQRLRRNLKEAQERIKDKSLEVKYLTELIQILSSKEAQERAEEQTLKQYDPFQDNQQQ